MPKRYKKQITWVRCIISPKFWPYHLIRRKAEVFFACGEWDQSEALYRRNIEMSNDGPVLAADAQSGLARLIVNRGKLGEAGQLFELARRTFKACGDDARLAPVLRGMGVLYAYQGEYQKARGQFARAAALARRTGDQKEFSHALGNLGIAYKSQGFYQKALECYRQEMAISEEIGDLMNIAQVENNLGLLYKEMRQFEKALAHFDRALSIADKVGDRSTSSYALGNIGTVHHDLGNFDLALKMYRQRLELTRQLGDRQSMAYTRINMGLLEQQRGRYDEAGVLYQESLGTMTELGDKRAIAIVTGKLAELYAITGRRSQARQHYQSAIEQAGSLNIDYYLCDMLYNFALLALEEGNCQESSELAALAKFSAEKSGRMDMVLNCRILEARLLSYQNKQQALEELKKLEEECPEDAQRAEALYHLYRIEPSWQLKEKLLTIYGSLLKKTPDQKYRDRINEIAGPAAGQPGDIIT